MPESDEIMVGRPLPRALIRGVERGYLATCANCKWQGVFPDGTLGRDAVATHYEREHYGPARYSVIALLDAGRAQVLDPDRGRLTAVQSTRPTFPRTTGDVSALVERGDLIRLPADREQLVVGVREQRALGLPTWSVRFTDPGVDLAGEDPNWRGMNELIARDGRVYSRFGEDYLGAPCFEVAGTADHQAALSQFESREEGSA